MNAADHSGEIRIRTSLRAERSRIFYALTLPEYMELWAGDADAIAVTGDCEPADGGTFRLVSSLANGSAFTITGRVEKYRPFGEVVFAWKHRLLGRENETRVRMNVLSRKASVLVAIGHSGLSSQVEHDYFQAMWTRCTSWLLSSFAWESHQPLSAPHWRHWPRTARTERA